MCEEEKKILFAFDPNKQFAIVQPNVILSALGKLPEWLITGVRAGMTAKEALLSQYKFYFGELDFLELNPDGSYDFAGDPTQHPLARVDLPDEIVYFYRYSFVAVVSKTSQWIARLD